MNSNLFHNILNATGAIIGLLTTILVALGCKLNDVTGALDCSGSTTIPPSLIQYFVAATTVIFFIKGIMNLMRDGLAGLTKQQPPVASEITTVVVASDKTANIPVVQVSNAQPATPAPSVKKV